MSGAGSEDDAANSGAISGDAPADGVNACGDEIFSRGARANDDGLVTRAEDVASQTRRDNVSSGMNSGQNVIAVAVGENTLCSGDDGDIA